MASTLGNMGLIKWDSVSDYFSHTQLAANFQAIDDHDHSAGKGVQISAAGLASSAVGTTQLATNSVTTTKITDANVTDAKLASPTNAGWKTLRSVGSIFQAATVTSSGVWFPTDSGTPIKTGVTGSLSVPVFFIPATANYAVANKTINYRVVANFTANSVAATATFTPAIYPLTFGGTGGNITYTAGSAVTNSATPATTAAITATTQGVNSNTSVVLGATTSYAIGVNMSAAMSANSAVAVYVRVEYSHV